VLRAIDATSYDAATAALRGHSVLMTILGAGLLAGLAVARYVRPRLMTGSDGGTPMTSGRAPL
jgi:hypothetical protein